MGSKIEKNSDEMSGGGVVKQDESTFVQYAKSRVNSAKKKLYGINPCVIMRDDLQSGVHKDRPAFLKHFVSAVVGEDATSKYLSQRGRILKEHGDQYRLTVEEQVSCLIEQSTDLNILGRTWCGWQPFV